MDDKRLFPSLYFVVPKLKGQYLHVFVVPKLKGHYLCLCSAKIAEEKLRYACYNCMDMDADVNPDE